MLYHARFTAHGLSPSSPEAFKGNYQSRQCWHKRVPEELKQRYGTAFLSRRLIMNFFFSFFFNDLLLQTLFTINSTTVLWIRVYSLFVGYSLARVLCGFKASGYNLMNLIGCCRGWSFNREFLCRTNEVLWCSKRKAVTEFRNRKCSLERQCYCFDFSLVSFLHLAKMELGKNHGMGFWLKNKYIYIYMNVHETSQFLLSLTL